MADKKAFAEATRRFVAQKPSTCGTASCRSAKPAHPLVAVSLIIALLVTAMLALPSCGRLTSSTDPDPEPAKYAVSIDEAVLGYDYGGRPAIIVTYTWQNNSNRETTFLTALAARCYQNGVELEHAYMVDGTDPMEKLAHVKPGSSDTVQQAYLLKDLDVPIDVEVKEFLSFDDTVLASTTYTRE